MMYLFVLTFLSLPYNTGLPISTPATHLIKWFLISSLGTYIEYIEWEWQARAEEKGAAKYYCILVLQAKGHILKKIEKTVNTDLITRIFVLHWGLGPGESYFQIYWAWTQ